MAKKKWGDRPDAVWLRELPAMNQIMTTLMPNRADNEAYVSVDIDKAPLEAYLEKKNQGLDKAHRYTFFHLIRCKHHNCPLNQLSPRKHS